MEDKFLSTVSSDDFDKALNGGLDFAEMKPDIYQLKADIADNSKSDAVAKRSLDALWKLNQGISYDFVTDSEETYEKTVPSGRKYATVEMIGGHTEVIDGALVNADVESVKYNGSVICIVPEAVRSMTGYGWSAGDVYNSIERTDGGKWQYHKRVGSVDLGTLNWSVMTVTVGGVELNAFCSSDSLKRPFQSGLIDYLCCKYQAVAYRGKLSNDKTISPNNLTSDNRIVVRDDSYTDAAVFKAAMSGVMLYYELAEPITTDITDMMADFQENFQAEAGGTITFENAAKLTVPNSVEYVVSLAEVGSV